MKRRQFLTSTAAAGAGIFFFPGRVVAGDLFDVVPVDEDRTAVLLGDVTGKGVAAAMLMTSVSRVLMCASSWAMTPASSSRFSTCKRPWVTATAPLAGLRPVAKAFGASSGMM